MSTWQWLVVSLLSAIAVYAGFVVALVIAGKADTARAVASLVPDCIVLFRRLIGDPRVPRSKKLLLAAVIPYLALPIDLVPDFIPVAGYLDDAVIVALALRHVLRGSDPAIITQHWPGPPASLAFILKLAGHAPTPPDRS